jgi:hypothetical protein
MYKLATFAILTSLIAAISACGSGSSSRSSQDASTKPRSSSHGSTIACLTQAGARQAKSKTDLKFMGDTSFGGDIAADAAGSTEDGLGLNSFEPSDEAHQDDWRVFVLYENLDGDNPSYDALDDPTGVKYVGYVRDPNAVKRADACF